MKANLYTIAPNLSGGLFIVLVCWISDKYQKRAFCAIGSLIISLMGFVVLGTADLVNHTGAGYFWYAFDAVSNELLSLSR